MSFWISGSSSNAIDFSNDLAAILSASATSVATAAVNAAGTGYTPGDILTVAGGTANIAAQIEVVTITGGGGTGPIGTIRIYNAGSYTVNPTLTANAVTGGTGSTATIDLTMSDVGWIVDRDQVWDGGSEREVIAHGEGGGSDTIYVGWRTFQDGGSDYYNMELHGMTGFSSGLPHDEQPGISPGFHDKVAPEDEGHYLILTNVSFNWWINVNSYRIIISAQIGTNVWHAYLGWGNRFGTSTEFPYPHVCSAPSIYHDVNNSTITDNISSIIDPWIAASTTLSAGTSIYQPGGGWQQCVNKRGTVVYDDYCVVPTQRPDGAIGSPSSPEDRFTIDNGAFHEIIFSITNGTPGTTDANLQPTGSTDARVLLPCHAVQSLPEVAVHLEFDEVRWLTNFGGINSGDRVKEVDGTIWRVFQNGNRSQAYSYLAIKEAD